MVLLLSLSLFFSSGFTPLTHGDLLAFIGSLQARLPCSSVSGSPRDAAMDYFCVCKPLTLGSQRWVLADEPCDPNLTRRQPAE